MVIKRLFPVLEGMGRPLKYTDQDFTDAVAAHSPASTSEIAEQVGCERQTADGRLKELAEEGEIQRKQIAKVTVWYQECR